MSKYKISYKFLICLLLLIHKTKKSDEIKWYEIHYRIN